MELADKESLINVYRDNDEMIEMTNIIFIYSDLVNAADELPSNSSVNMTQNDLQQIMDSGLKRIKVRKIYLELSFITSIIFVA